MQYVRAVGGSVGSSITQYTIDAKNKQSKESNELEKPVDIGLPISK